MFRAEDLDRLLRDPSTLDVKDEKSLTSLREQLIKILKHKSLDLITVFNIESGIDGGGDIEMAILKAFLNCNFWVDRPLLVYEVFKLNVKLWILAQRVKHYENLKLAISWNRIDIARELIFTGDESFRPGELNNLLELALILNKPDFVELLLENNINIVEFLTCRRLYYLYNYDVVSDQAQTSCQASDSFWLIWNVLSQKKRLRKPISACSWTWGIGRMKIRISYLSELLESFWEI